MPTQATQSGQSPVTLLPCSTNIKELLPLNVREVGSLAIWSLSSCKAGYGVEQLRDDCFDTYWQSDGPQPHLINVHFRRKTPLQCVAVYADYKADESYTPSKLSIKLGTHFNDLVELKTIELQEPNGWTVIDLRDISSTSSPKVAHHQHSLNGGCQKAFLLQIAILQNHQNGRDTHIRQVKVFAPEPQQLFSSVEMNQHAVLR